MYSEVRNWYVSKQGDTTKWVVVLLASVRTRCNCTLKHNTHTHTLANSLKDSLTTFRAAEGTFTLPMACIFFLPAACFCSSFFLPRIAEHVKHVWWGREGGFIMLASREFGSE